jgi:hypothetical protein
MQPMISLRVEHTDYNDFAGFNPVEYFVVESMRLHPSETAIINRVPFRRHFEQTQSLADLVKKLTA